MAQWRWIVVNVKALVADCKPSPTGSLRRLLVAAALPAVAATALFLGSPSPASAGVGIDIQIAPPAPLGRSTSAAGRIRLGTRLLALGGRSPRVGRWSLHT